MNIYYALLSIILGLVFGSFGNAWAWRIAHGENIAKGRSHCVKCNHELTSLDLVPVFSYLFLKGKCRYCGEKISGRYPLSEIMLGFCFLSVFLRWGFTLDTIRFIVLFFLLFVMSLVDLDTLILPDGLMIAAAVAALLRLPDWKSILIGAVAITVPLIIIVLIMDKVLKKESFGGGDIKLIAVLGMHFGAAQTLLLLIIACIVGLTFALISKTGKGKAFPFGPMLSIAAFICCMCGTNIINWYMSFFV